MRFTDIIPSLCLGLLVAMVAGNTAFAGGMTLTSGEFSDGDYLVNEQVFAGFGCEGQNVSPSLSWSGAPEGTKPLALTVYDPDAPGYGGPCPPQGEITRTATCSPSTRLIWTRWT